MRDGRTGRLPEQLCHVDLVIIDELGYLPFAQAAGNCCSTSSAAFTNAPRVVPRKYGGRPPHGLALHRRGMLCKNGFK